MDFIVVIEFTLENWVVQKFKSPSGGKIQTRDFELSIDSGPQNMFWAFVANLIVYFLCYVSPALLKYKMLTDFLQICNKHSFLR